MWHNTQKDPHGQMSWAVICGIYVSTEPGDKDEKGWWVNACQAPHLYQPASLGSASGF